MKIHLPSGKKIGWIFAVSSLRQCLDNSILTPLEHIKIDIHSWRLINDRLPTRFNLDIRGIELDSIRCPVCDNAIETAQHLFMECSVSRTVVTGCGGGGLAMGRDVDGVRCCRSRMVKLVAAGGGGRR
ncbi:hypothetical protein CTI12_AA280940 [Artemisia annua]|uniref:Reverse transcriptase zinc-binding domain-containing protein n=1 Tax=Artemisia annua TaxID=35608 RepID=A0A2U1ND24_ARTAN|nr:hypothetical protein CTI12_AA280940 [Artemisia annua]